MRAPSVLLLALVFAGCAPGTAGPATAPAADPAGGGRFARLEAQIPGLIAKHRVAGVGIALIEESQVVWSGSFGERAPGEPVTAETMFNTASVAKTVTAETVLRLVQDGRISLDEPISRHWTEDDLAGDPRYGSLTPRILLSHRSGLLNWPFAYEDGKLAFVSEPGERLTYSGAGYEMLAHFVEAKLGEDFEALARSAVFEPMGLRGISLSRREWIDPFIPRPMDGDGVYHPPYTYPGSGWVKPIGYWDGADDLYVTVADYATFLLGVMNGDGLSEELAAERFDIVSDASGIPGWACVVKPPERCPERHGYGLGWTVFEYPDRTFVQHGGTDFGEHAMVYFVPETRQGVVIFVNGGNGTFVALDILDLIEERHPLAEHFRAILAELQPG